MEITNTTRGYIIEFSAAEQRQYFTRRERRTGKFSPERMQEIIDKLSPNSGIFVFLEPSSQQITTVSLDLYRMKVAAAKIALHDKLTRGISICRLGKEDAANFLDCRPRDVERLSTAGVLTRLSGDEDDYSADEVLALRDSHIEWDPADYEAMLRGELKNGTFKIVRVVER